MQFWCRSLVKIIIERSYLRWNEICVCVAELRSIEISRLHHLWWYLLKVGHLLGVKILLIDSLVLIESIYVVFIHRLEKGLLRILLLLLLELQAGTSLSLWIHIKCWIKHLILRYIRELFVGDKRRW